MTEYLLYSQGSLASFTICAEPSDPKGYSTCVDGTRLCMCGVIVRSASKSSYLYRFHQIPRARMSRVAALGPCCGIERLLTRSSEFTAPLHRDPHMTRHSAFVIALSAVHLTPRTP